MYKKVLLLLTTLLMCIIFVPSFAYASEELEYEIPENVLYNAGSASYSVRLNKPLYYFEGEPYQVTCEIIGGNPGDTYIYRWEGYWGIASQYMEWHDFPESDWYIGSTTQTFGFMTDDDDGSADWSKSLSAYIDAIRCVVVNQKGETVKSESYRVPQPSPKNIINMAIVTDFSEPIVGMKLDYDVSTNMMSEYFDVKKVEWYKGSNNYDSLITDKDYIAKKGERYFCRIYLKSKVVFENNQPTAYKLGTSTRAVVNYSDWNVYKDADFYYMSSSFTPSNEIKVISTSELNPIGTVKDNVILSVDATNVDTYQWQIYENGQWTNITYNYALSLASHGEGIATGYNSKMFTFSKKTGNYKLRCVMNNSYGYTVTSPEFNVTMSDLYKLSSTNINVDSSKSGSITVNNPDWMADCRYIWYYYTNSDKTARLCSNTLFFTCYETKLNYKNIPESYLNGGLKVYCLIQYNDGRGAVSSQTCEFSFVNNTFTGIKCGNDGIWYYYYNGNIATGFSGLVEESGNTYYIDNGCVNFNKNGFADGGDGYWYFFRDGAVAKDLTGYVRDTSGQEFYIENGRVKFDAPMNPEFCGIARADDGDWYYYYNGKIAKDFTGLVNDWTGNSYYVENGKVNFNKNGFADGGDGYWYFFRDGAVANDLTGYVRDTSGQEFYIENGRVKFDAPMNPEFCGIARADDGNWYYYYNGRVANDFTGLVNDWTGNSYYIENGKVDFNKNGFADGGDGYWYFFRDGAVAKDLTGWVLDSSGTEYYIENGKVDFSKTK